MGGALPTHVPFPRRALTTSMPALHKQTQTDSPILPQSSWLQRCMTRCMTKRWTSTRLACACWSWPRWSTPTASAGASPPSSCECQRSVWRCVCVGVSNVFASVLRGGASCTAPAHAPSSSCSLCLVTNTCTCPHKHTPLNTQRRAYPLQRSPRFPVTA